MWSPALWHTGLGALLDTGTISEVLEHSCRRAVKTVEGLKHKACEEGLGVAQSGEKRG